MRRIARLPLDAGTAAALAAHQARLDGRSPLSGGEIGTAWQAARPTHAVQTAIAVLRQMAGPAENCMYCATSDGSDVEHFWPKSRYPARAFRWDNLLLNCSTCGRLKGDRFPLADGDPLLIDPTQRDPWRDLDFDPSTGVVMARFLPDTGEKSPRGDATVTLLKLNRRGRLATIHQQTFKILAERVQRCLNGEIADDALVAELQAVDDHGLLGWCFGPLGAKPEPFAALRRERPAAWLACEAAFG